MIDRDIHLHILTYSQTTWDVHLRTYEGRGNVSLAKVLSSDCIVCVVIVFAWSDRKPHIVSASLGFRYQRVNNKYRYLPDRSSRFQIQLSGTSISFLLLWMI